MIFRSLLAKAKRVKAQGKKKKKKRFKELMDIQTKKSHKAISLTGVGECVMCRSTFAKYFSTSSYLNWEARMQGYKYTCNTTELFAEH